MATRDRFKTRVGFILSCIGSAVGMASIWLFPIRVGQFGGAAFLIPYFLFIFLLGFTGVIGEMSLGRAMKTGPIGAFKKAFEKRNIKGGQYIGLIPVFGSLAIAIGYSIVVGWILNFTINSISNNITSDHFNSISDDFGSLGFHIGVLVLVYFISLGGISNGIERINKILMPLFFIFFLILAIRVAFLNENVFQGYVYLFKPNWELLLDIQTWIYALGQALFALSLAGSGTVVYGSYLSQNENIIESAKNVVIFDSIAGMLCALVIIPAVFAFNLPLDAGPSLLFITMPEVFKFIPMGQFFMFIFFLAVFFAGITSLINLFETPIEALQDRFKLSRSKSTFIILSIALAVGVFLENGKTLGAWMDAISIYVIPLGAFLAGVVFFWVLGFPFAKEQAQLGYNKPLPNFFEFFSKYIFCSLMLIVYILGIFFGSIG